MKTVVILPQPSNLPRDDLAIIDRPHGGRIRVHGDLCPLLPLDPVLRRVKKPVLVPLGTCARLPGRCAQVAELVPATTRHVVASDGEFDEVAASRASLPSRFLGQCDEARVLLACAALMHIVRCLLATSTSLCPTLRAGKLGCAGRAGADEGGT